MRNIPANAPTFVVWVVSLILFILALAAHFGVIHPGAQVAAWSWIFGFALLLLACRIKGM